MSYAVDYDTLPVFNNNSLGKLSTTISRTFVNPIWFAPTPNTLTPGVYFISSSISYLNSPNTYAYIILDKPNDRCIFFDSNKTPSSLNQFVTYQGANPNASDILGNQWSTYTSWFPVAGQQMRNGAASGSNCLSLSAIVTVSVDTNVTTLAYTQSSGATSFITQHCVRIT